MRGPKEWDGRLARRIGVCPSKTKIENENEYDYENEYENGHGHGHENGHENGHEHEHEHEHENGDLVPVPPPPQKGSVNNS